MTRQQKTRLALVGFGRWGSRLVDSVNGKSAIVEFTTVVSRSPSRIAGAAEERELCVRERLEDVLTDDRIGGVVLATPHSLHADGVISCARARKHVFVEKPFALTLSEAERALNAASTAGIVLGVGHNRRFLPSMIKLLRMVESGALGEIMHIDACFCGDAATRYQSDHWRAGPGESPAGGLAGSGIHMIDAIVALAGPISSVYATASRRVVRVPIYDTTACVFKLSSGASASLTNVVATARAFRLQVFGSEASVELRGTNELVYSPVGEGAVTEAFSERSTERAELEAFANAIAGRSSYPVTHEEILNGVAAFEAICRSQELDQVVTLGR